MTCFSMRPVTETVHTVKLSGRVSSVRPPSVRVGLRPARIIVSGAARLVVIRITSTGLADDWLPSLQVRGVFFGLL